MSSEEEPPANIYTYDINNYYTSPQTPDTPIKELAEGILHLHITEEGDKILADEEEPFTIEIELPENDLEKFRIPMKPKKRKKEIVLSQDISNINRRHIYSARNDFYYFAKSLKKDIFYELAELADLYNNFFNINPPITPIGFGHLKENIFYFTKKRIGRNKKTVNKLKENIPNLRELIKMKRDRTSTEKVIKNLKEH